MINYYNILGVDESASQEDIKRAYKKLAMQHHPDRGGDTEKFKEISQANDTLSDPDKRARYDAERSGAQHFNYGGGHPFGANQFDFGNMSDIFGFSFGPGFAGFERNMRRNKDLNVRVSISLKQSYTGAQLEANYKLPTGKSQTVLVDLPAGIESGQVIRYQGLGDDSIPNVQRGNLNVTVLVEPDPVFARKGNDLLTTVEISVLEAMTGCTKDLVSLDDTPMQIKIRAGAQHGTEYAVTGKGFKDLQSNKPGNFIVGIKVNIPAITNSDDIQKLKDIYANIAKTS